MTIPVWRWGSLSRQVKVTSAPNENSPIVELSNV